MEGSSSDVWSAFCYDLAMVRGIANSLPDNALRKSDSVVVDLQTATEQHREYTEVSSPLQRAILTFSLSVSYCFRYCEN